MTEPEAPSKIIMNNACFVLQYQFPFVLSLTRSPSFALSKRKRMFSTSCLGHSRKVSFAVRRETPTMISMTLYRNILISFNIDGQTNGKMCKQIVFRKGVFVLPPRGFQSGAAPARIEMSRIGRGGCHRNTPNPNSKQFLKQNPSISPSQKIKSKLISCGTPRQCCFCFFGY